MKLVIQIVLWIVIVFLGWKLWNSVMGPVEFNKVKEARYVKVISNLKDIQAAELAHKEINGSFTGDWDSLINFIETAKFAITQRRDTSYADVAKNKAFGINEGYFLEESLIDTLGFTPVKDSLYKGTDRYKTMMNVPVDGVNAKFDLKAGKIVKNDATYSVFEAKVSKKVILSDLDKDLLAQELQVQSVDGVNGPDIKVGSLEDVNTTGNWPKIYDSARN
ncbi:hypothetical protein Aeqsu_2521 [Aequorivita sublithincola DSM 14238]|uniref:Uncharacterized protein n=1 Tax=Aequorivita sublithincola (strain DSM 14238 / LMG 21431 / ACAM 643 / 9-3) TaxID=746697 RepID=I3YYA9_AEQSU|nr:hypothetical protein [Aequorivita sublithincola]AFL81977.1 hypothetical protein Aeqsu_2521 [Aequorivita sublithincola DSM 14238]